MFRLAQAILRASIDFWLSVSNSARVIGIPYACLQICWWDTVMCVCVCVCGFCNVWVCVCVGFVMCVNFGNMCTCIYCILYHFIYVYVLLLVLSVLPPSDNSTAVTSQKTLIFTFNILPSLRPLNAQNGNFNYALKVLRSVNHQNCL
jgi:hypothetical protein